MHLPIRSLRLGALMIGLTAGCKPRASVEPTAEIVSRAGVQLLPDSLEVTPRIDVVENMPEPGLLGLSLHLLVQNRRQRVSVALPCIGFRFWREGVDAASSNPAWHRPARYPRRRTGVDSLIPGGGFGFGLSTSPRLIVRSANDEGVYRVEAYLVEPAGAERTVDMGHVRLRFSGGGTTAVEQGPRFERPCFRRSSDGVA